MRSSRIPVIAVMALALLVWPSQAYAYVGPGIGLTIIGAAVAFVAGIFLAVGGFVWYPIKRLLRAISRRRVATINND